MTTKRNLSRTLMRAAALLAGLAAWSCAEGGSSSTGSATAAGGTDLLQVASGRLVDVWATLDAGGLTLIQKDMVIGTDIQDDERAGKHALDVVYTFETAGAGSGRETLLIHIDPKLDPVSGLPMSPRFLEAFDRLDDNLAELGANYYGQDQGQKPFPVAPRNAAIRLRFSKDLGLSQTFFTLHRDDDPASPPVGLRNTRAIQLLEILGDPTLPGAEDLFRVIPARVIYQGDRLVLDPVMLREGPGLGLPNNPEGLPASRASSGANIRVALPLEGPSRVPGLGEKSPLLVGVDAYGLPAVTRDFRSGNAGDDGTSLARGFLNDPIPPRIAGEQIISLIGLEDLGPGQKYLTLYQEAMKHTQKYLAVGDEGWYSPVEIDALDRIEILVRGAVAATAVIVAKPEQIVFRDGQGIPEMDKYGNPRVHYRVKTDLSQADFERFKMNMNRDPGSGAYLPTDVVQVTNFQAQVAKLTPKGARVVLARDDPRYFLTFSPPAPDPRFPTDNISPFAGVLVRFTKPVDIGTIRAFDSLILSVDADVNKVMDAQAGTAGLIVSRIYDEDGTRCRIRTQPPLGFYHTIAHSGTSKVKGPWDPTLYRQTSTQGLPDPTDLFHLFLIPGANGVKGMVGNPVDLQGPALDAVHVEFTLRADAPTNRVANIARRFLHEDEDPNPAVKDLFGAHALLPGGRLMGRPGARVSSFADNLNQTPEPPEPEFKFCPPGSLMDLTGSVVYGAPIQDPLNPMGCRLQTCWREIDLSLSRFDPFDYNLDVERMWWAPFRLGPIFDDTFDKISLYVHHSEYRPSPCVGLGSALPYFHSSGLVPTFRNNYLDSSDPVRAFESEKLLIQASDAVYEPNNVNRFMPLPKFQKPYLVFRDERDLRLGGGSTEPVLSPFLTKGVATMTLPNFGGTTANSLPTIALPLLADFFIFPDDPQLGGASSGFNGWQIAVTVMSAPQPNFRVYSAGGYKPPGIPDPPTHGGGVPDWVDPSTQTTAQGGYTIQGARTPSGDNTFYWTRVDFLKRLSVVTNGFVQLHSPNKAKNALALSDPRLANFPSAARPAVFDLVLEPPLASLPQGTRVIPAFRGAYSEGPGALANGMLDPRAAGEVHAFTGTAAYFQECSNYYESPNDLLDPAKLKSVAGAALDPSQVRYFNWRLVFQNNMDVDPPLTPVIDSLGIVYRFDR